MGESSTSRCRYTLSLGVQRPRLELPPDTRHLGDAQQLGGHDGTHDIQPRTLGNVLSMSTATLFQLWLHHPPGWGLWSACTQEWIAGIWGQAFLASMWQGQEPVLRMVCSFR